MSEPPSVDLEVTSGQVLRSRTSGERDANQPQVRDQTEPSVRQRNQHIEFRGGGLVNVSSRPVELHLAAGVVVLGPRERFDCEPADLGLGHVQALCQQGVLQEVAPEPEPPQEKPRRAPAKRKRSAQKES